MNNIQPYAFIFAASSRLATGRQGRHISLKILIFTMKRQLQVMFITVN